ncbi:MAG: aldose 1-epimerase family protein [Johnsonella sp.]|nr:aldose 1-epimerase family protein [Johnsonella sp.]
MNIRLQSEGFSALISTKGAELKSLKNPEQKEFMWQSDPDFWRFSSPLLFPLIGNARKDRCLIKGKSYFIPKHGFARHKEFSLKNHSESRAVFSLTPDEDMLSCYPYPFLLDAEFSLHKHTLDISYTVYNRDIVDMYYQIGAHPGFVCPSETEESFDQYSLCFEQEESFESYLYDIEKAHFCSEPVYPHKRGKTIALSKELFLNDALYFPRILSRKITLRNAKDLPLLALEFEDFSSFALWTPADPRAEFICLEPWNGSAILDKEDDLLSSRHDIQSLKPGEHKTYRLRIELLS